MVLARNGCSYFFSCPMVCSFHMLPSAMKDPGCHFRFRIAIRKLPATYLPPPLFHALLWNSWAVRSAGKFSIVKSLPRPSKRGVVIEEFTSRLPMLRAYSLQCSRYSKMPFYAISGGVCALLLCIWLLLCVRWWTDTGKPNSDIQPFQLAVR